MTNQRLELVSRRGCPPPTQVLLISLSPWVSRSPRDTKSWTGHGQSQIW